jgi:hypothetical protein
MGDDVTQKAATKEREVVKRYKDFELTEDLATGKKQFKEKKRRILFMMKTYNKMFI